MNTRVFVVTRENSRPVQEGIAKGRMHSLTFRDVSFIATALHLEDGSFIATQDILAIIYNFSAEPMYLQNAYR